MYEEKKDQKLSITHDNVKRLDKNTNRLRDKQEKYEGCEEQKMAT